MALNDIPAVCITLNPSKEERAVRALKEIQELGFRDPTFLIGARGKDLTDKELKELLDIRAYFELKNGRYVHEALSGLGSVGCYLSHIEAWRYCINLGVPLAVFEDDFAGVPECKQKMTNALKEAKRLNYDILRFQHHYNPDIGEELEDCGSDILYKIGRTQGLATYIITPKAAKTLIAGFDSGRKLDVHVDHFLDMACMYYGLNHYCTKESLFDDPQVASDIGHNSIKIYKESFTSDTSLKRHCNCLIVIAGLATLVLLIIFKILRKN